MRAKNTTVSNRTQAFCKVPTHQVYYKTIKISFKQTNKPHSEHLGVPIEQSEWHAVQTNKRAINFSIY